MMSSTDEKFLQAARNVFKRSQWSDPGTPLRPTTAGFVALAEAGAGAWNAWRREYPGPVVDFSGTVFGKEIDFSGFLFAAQEDSEGPKLSNTIFKKKVSFNGAKLGKSVDFRGSIFEDIAEFDHAKFGDHANFSNCEFKKGGGFNKVEFGINANFSSCIFNRNISFNDSHFDNGAQFFRAKFERIADFSECKFGDEISFYGSTFGILTVFSDCSFYGSSTFSAEATDDTPSAAKNFYAVLFKGAKFIGNADFSDRIFKGPADFSPSILKKNSPTTFHGAPVFHGCTLHQDTNFKDAKFMASHNQDIVRAYRTLKLAMERLKATREEQKFFRLEMKAEHPGLQWGKRWISALYSVFSDYGFSLRRPISALLFSAFLISAAQGALINMHAGHEGLQATIFTSRDADANRTWQWLRYVAINTLPVPGFDKTQMELRDALFGKDGAIVSVAMGLEMIHKVISLGCVFLLGLALRNLFKMKS